MPGFLPAGEAQQVHPTWDFIPAAPLCLTNHNAQEDIVPNYLLLELCGCKVTGIDEQPRYSFCACKCASSSDAVLPYDGNEICLIRVFFFCS